MKHKAVTTLTVIMALVAGALVALVGAGAAGASDTPYLVGYAGGSQIHAAGDTATSSPSAESQLGASGPGASDSNSTPAVAVKGVLALGEVATSVHTDAVSGGYQVVAQSRTSDVDLLDGLVKAASVTTTTTTSLVNGKAAGNSTTEVEGLQIAGQKVNRQVPNNFARGVPGVAVVSVNGLNGQYKGSTGMTMGTGLMVQLLKAQGGEDKGSTIYVNPTFTSATIASPLKHAVAARAFGTSVQSNTDNLVQVNSDPSAPVATSGVGTNGTPTSDSVAGVHVTQAASTGTITNTVNGTTTSSSAKASAQSSVNGVNLFNGLITANVIEADVNATSAAAALGSTTLGNLKIAGRSIPTNVAPNTTQNILGVGKVVINQQVRDGRTLTVRGLDITLSQKKFGLPAGAEVQVAVASAAAV